MRSLGNYIRRGRSGVQEYLFRVSWLFLGLVLIARLGRGRCRPSSPWHQLVFSLVFVLLSLLEYLFLLQLFLFLLRCISGHMHKYSVYWCSSCCVMTLQVLSRSLYARVVSPLCLCFDLFVLFLIIYAADDVYNAGICLYDLKSYAYGLIIFWLKIPVCIWFLK